MRKVFVIIVLAAIFALALNQDRNHAGSTALHLQGIESVVSAQLIPAHGGFSNNFLTLDSQNPKDKEVITKVLNWLNSATIVGDAKDQFISYGGSPTDFNIKFQSGLVIVVEDAFGSKSKKLDNGSIEVHSDSIPNQVTVFEGNKTHRIDSPELKAWIEDGWQFEEAFLFTPEEAIAKVLKEHPELPATNVNQVYEDIGGVQAHNQPVTLTTKAEKRGPLNYIVTFTKDYNFHVRDAEAIQSWVYSVDPSNVALIDKQDNVPSIK